MRHTILCTALLCACTDEVPAQLHHDATVDTFLDVADASQEASQDVSVDASVSMDASDGGLDAQ
jgi:hypothetical protein